MYRSLILLATASLLLSACTGRNGTVDNGSSAVSQPEQLPEAEIFRAGLPMEPEHPHTAGGH